MLSPAEERLKDLWLEAIAASDHVEKDTLLFEFRDAVHDLLDQHRAEVKNFPQRTRLAS
jgi:hypothetical protein